MTTFLTCNVSSGQFRDEYAVKAQAQNGEFSLFAPESCVKIREGDAVCAGQEKPGLLAVKLLESDESRALVELPAQAFENGNAVTVARSQIKELNLG